MYLINRVPSRIVQFQTPLEALTSHHEVPSVLRIPPRVFGCIAFFQNHAHQRSKLDPCALKCVFVGYSSSQKGYKSYHPPSRKFYVTMDLTFQEGTPYYLPSPSFQGERQLIEEKSDKDPSFLPWQSIPNKMAIERHHPEVNLIMQRSIPGRSTRTWQSWRSITTQWSIDYAPFSYSARPIDSWGKTWGNFRYWWHCLWF